MQTRTASGSMKRRVYDNEEEQADGSGKTPETPADKPIPKPRKRAKRSSINIDDKEAGSSSKQKGKGKGKATQPINNRGRKEGRLAKFLEMPMDIFCEISRHLDPVDLLQLSRSSKSFNDMLTSRNSKPLWRAARGAMPELPDCPVDLAEFAYARLLFLKECQGCLSRVMKPDYVLHSRLCRRCQGEHVKPGDFLLQNVPGLTEDLLECVPGHRITSWYNVGVKSYIGGSFLKISAERVVKQCIEAVSPTLSSDDATKARAKFIQDKKDLLPQREAHTRLLEKWATNQVYAKHVSDGETCKRRRDAIRNNLLALGYLEEDIPSLNFSMEWNSIVNQPRDLTPRIWKNACPKLENIIGTYKIYREKVDKEARKKRRREEIDTHLQPMLASMSTADPNFHFLTKYAHCLPTCIVLMEENEYRNAITDEKWSQFSEQVINDIRDKINEQDQSLIHSVTSLNPNNLPKSLTLPNTIDKNFLISPSTYFICKTCGYVADYLHLQMHYCRRCGDARPEFAFSAEKTLVAQVFLAHIPAGYDERSIKEEKLKCHACSDCPTRPTHFSWTSLLCHFVPVEEKKASSNCFVHVLEEELAKDEPVYSVHLDSDSDSDYDGGMFPYYMGDMDLYDSDDDDMLSWNPYDHPYYADDIDEPMGNCIIS